MCHLWNWHSKRALRLECGILKEWREQVPFKSHSLFFNQMVFVISKLNNCTYKLDANNQRVLMYAPLLSDGSYETAGSAYDWVEWDELDPDVLEEADRIHKLLLEDVR